MAKKKTPKTTKPALETQEKTIPNKVNTRLIGTIVLIGLIIIGGIWYFNNMDTSKTSSAPRYNEATESIELPASWSVVDDTPAALMVKLEKKAEVFTPTAVVSNTQIDDSIEKPRDYVESLKTGAQSTIPSLEILDEQEEMNETYYIKTIKMRYIEGTNTITVLQKLYIKEREVYTITASYLTNDNATEKELTDVFIYLTARYIP